MLEDQLDGNDEKQTPRVQQATNTPNGTVRSTKKRRRKRTSQPHIVTQLVIRHPRWVYIHLQHLPASASASASEIKIDEITAHLHLNAALSQFLGLHGAAIPFDILKVEGQDVWIRLPAEDRPLLVAAVGGWVGVNGNGWNVKGWSPWDASASRRDGGQDLFLD